MHKFVARAELRNAYKIGSKRLLRIDKISIENIYFEDVNDEDVMVVRAKMYSRELNRCPICGMTCSGYDSGGSIRRWRSLDFGTTRVYIEANAPRVTCRKHGVHVARVPWARHDSAYTKDFEQAVTWFALHATATDVSEYFRIKWHTVGTIAKRVQNDLENAKGSRFDGLFRIGIDETSYKKGHKYMTVIVNHDTGALIWAKKGHGKEVLKTFFESLTAVQRESIKLVSADGARWIADCVTDFCPNAERCIDPFHVVSWANDAVDEVRKQTVRQARQDASEDKKAERVKKKRIQSTSGSPS